MHNVVSIKIYIKIGCYMIHLCYKSLLQLASIFKVIFSLPFLLYYISFRQTYKQKIIHYFAK